MVIIAASVYIRNGKSQQFELYFLQGQQYALQAENQVNDAPTRLASLQQSLYWLEKAADYGHTPESDLLRTKVQTALDNIQGIVRLNLKSLTDQSVIGDVSISQMAATTTDLYVLDDKTGRVFRFYLSGSGYQHDSEFDCGPNAANPMNTIGKLVDILPLPVGNQFKATLFGIDATGNIEFCIPGDSGISTVLNPPDMGWGNIKSVSLFQNYLYLLDIGGNAVYRYQGSGISFEEKPTLYFDNQIPSLVDALDIEVNGDELYILRSNGEMVDCTYSHIKDYKLTECNDPAPYSDMRTGQAPQAINFPEAQFSQMRMTSAPDSSIYLMDVNGGTIFHFSLQRNLQRILHPRFPDQPDNVRIPLTAFAVSPGKVAFLAYGNKVFYAPLP